MRFQRHFGRINSRSPSLHEKQRRCVCPTFVRFFASGYLHPVHMASITVEFTLVPTRDEVADTSATGSNAVAPAWAVDSPSLKMSLVTLNSAAESAMSRVIQSSGISLRFRGYRNLSQQLTSSSGRINFHTSLSNITDVFRSFYDDYVAATGANLGGGGGPADRAGNFSQANMRARWTRCNSFAHPSYYTKGNGGTAMKAVRAALNPADAATIRLFVGSKPIAETAIVCSPPSEACAMTKSVWA